MDYPVPVLGFSAYSGTGKTTLIKKLLPILSNHGLRIGMVKHTHHNFDIDYPGKDSYELRHAGAVKMLVISRRRMAYIKEFNPEQVEPVLEQALGGLDPSEIDIVLVEGFKHAQFPKIELFRPELNAPVQFPLDQNIIALASNVKSDQLPGNHKLSIPLLNLDNPKSITDFIIGYLDSFKNGGTDQKPDGGIIPKIPSCADNFEPGSLTVSSALQTILNNITPLQDSEHVPTRDALNRVLANNLVSSINIPGYTNSAVDGYALNGSDLPVEGTRDLKIIGTAMAGGYFEGHCNKGQCVRIMTGAVMPQGTDTVIMQEHIRLTEQSITIDATHHAGQNVRQAGEDISIGDTVLPEGKRITAADLGVIASLGLAETHVIRRPRVAFFSTGDELRGIGDGDNRLLSKGEIYDSNRYSLYGMLQRLNVDPIDMGVIRDRKCDVKQAFEHAASMADIVITSGGVSVGEADYIKEILEQTGQIHFWKIAMKPGRPLTFGHLEDSLFFGLPGNPVAVMVTFYQFVKPAIEFLMTGTVSRPLVITATCQSNLKKKIGRFEFIRGIYDISSEGSISVCKTRFQGSGILTSMSDANCFILLDEGRGNVSAGDAVLIQPFESII